MGSDKFSHLEVYGGETVHGGTMYPLVNQRQVKFLTYPIREIVGVVNKLKNKAGVPDGYFDYQNIGDPVAHGWKPPESFARHLLEAQFDVGELGRADLISALSESGELKDLDLGESENVGRIVELVLKRVQERLKMRPLAYAPSLGEKEFGDWVIEKSREKDPGSTLTPENVIFTNGSGDALHMIRAGLAGTARIIGPAPGYPASTAFEEFFANAQGIHYPLIPTEDFRLDRDRLEEITWQNAESTAGISVMRVGNPTGTVFSDDDIEFIFREARKAHLFVELDDAYINLVHGIEEDEQGKYGYALGKKSITELAREMGVPLIILRSGSKDIPWPGGRAAWMEIYPCEDHNNSNFADYVALLRQVKMQTVGSVHMPQFVLPAVYEDPEFKPHNARMKQKLQMIGKEMAAFCNSIEGIACAEPKGGMFCTPFFEQGTLVEDRKTIPYTLPIEIERAESIVKYDILVENKPQPKPDERFVYYLLAATGIVAPASSGFNGPYGVRLPLFTRDAEKRRAMLEKFKWAVETYLSSLE